jgi:mannose-6-phosphate isomerase-like protein (cupin superfamily)
MKIYHKGDGGTYVPPGHDANVIAQKLFDPSNGSSKVDVHITTFAPGTSMAEEVHKKSDHVLYLLAGRLELKQKGKSVAILTAGDAVHIPAGESHQMANPGKEPGTFFVITVPPTD